MNDPRQIAAGFLAGVKSHVWDGVTLPVPVEAIADSHVGLLVREVPVGRLSEVTGAPPDKELSGLLLVETGEIWVNAWEAQEYPGRKRFTIGHELGHWEMHRARGSMFCRTVESPTVDIEEEASLFGAALMFPDALVRKHYARLEGEIGTLCELFGASRAAMERAIVFSVRRPLLEGLTGVEFFHHDDLPYVAWRAAHPEGFVLNDDLGPGPGCRLHRAGCSYLDRAVRDGDPPRTRHPKWCAEAVEVLEQVLPAIRCPRCLSGSARP